MFPGGMVSMAAGFFLCIGIVYFQRFVIFVNSYV